MKFSSALGKNLLLAVLATGAFALVPAGSASATAVPPVAPPGQATVITYHEGSPTGEIVGQRTLGNCTPSVNWGSTTRIYTFSYLTCGQSGAQQIVARPATRQNPLSPPAGQSWVITYYSDASHSQEVGQTFSGPCASHWGTTSSFYTTGSTSCG